MLIHFLDFSNRNVYLIELNKVPVEIQKPQTVSNENFIRDMTAVVESLDTDLMYFYTDFSKAKPEKNYYITTNTVSFINPVVRDAGEILAKYSCISSNGGGTANSFLLNGSTFFNHINIYPFEKADQFNLQDAVYYFDKSAVDQVIAGINLKGYSAMRVQDGNSIRRYADISSMIFPAVLLFFSTLYCAVKDRKGLLLRKMMGYSGGRILWEGISDKIVKLTGISFLLELLNLFLVGSIYKGTLWHYFLFTFPFTVLGIAVISLILAVVYAVCMLSGDYEVLKGKKRSLRIYLLTVILKMIFIILTAGKLHDVILEVKSIYDITEMSQDVSEKLAGYVSLPIYADPTIINADNQLEYNKIMDQYYNQTVEKYSGILINTNNFKSYNPANDDSLAQLYGQNDIVVNENYLELNPIHDTGGNLITVGSLKKNKLNILLPDNTDVSGIVTRYAYKYKIPEEEISAVCYRKEEYIQGFNPYVGRENQGYMNQPVILVYDEKYFWDQMLNYVSGQYYFIKTNTEEPYLEIQPLLKKLGIDGIMVKTEYISNVYNQSMSQMMSLLLFDLMQIFLMAAALFITISYHCRTFFELFHKEIIIKYLYGYGEAEIYLVPVALQMIQLCFLLAVKIIRRLDLFTILLIMLIELAALMAGMGKNRKMHMAELLKGCE